MENRIRGERTNKKMSQDELALILEVSSQTLSKWEKNSDVCPIGKAIEMSKIFGCTIDYLVGLSETRRFE